MELRKACNHPALCYPLPYGPLSLGQATLGRCGKMWMLDRVLVKLKRAGA